MSANVTETELWNLRGRIDKAAKRVQTTPDPTNPEWCAALDELTKALAIAKEIDPLYREAGDVSADDINQILDCTCIEFCDEDPKTACRLSGIPHVHPDDPNHPGAYGPCPVHPGRPGDH